jgi:hypothetical protein
VPESDTSSTWRAGTVSQARFQKQQREKARRERAAAKWAKRIERSNAETPEPSEPPRDQAVVLSELAELHARFEAGQVSFEDFEVTKQTLTEQLDVR